MGDFATFLNCDEAAHRFIEEWHCGGDTLAAKTSGSTGKPKHIELLRQDMISSAGPTVKFFEIKPDALLHCPLSCNYIAGKMMAVRGEVAGCRVDFSKEIISREGKPRLTSIVPAQIEKLLCARHNPNFPEIVLIGGAPISQAQKEALEKAKVNAYVSYGMTETCSHVALRKIEEECYIALPGITFSTDNRDCLIISSNERSFKSLITNDVVKIVDKTRFKWIGRIDNVINTGGVKVYPEEVEEILRRFLPDDIQFYITWRRDSKWGQAVVMVTEKPIEIPEQALLQLQPAQRPKEIIIDNILFTNNNKILRQSYNDYSGLNY